MGNNLLPFCVLACSYMGKLIVQSQVYGKTKYTAKVCNLVIENITFSYMVSHIGRILGDVMDFFQIMLHLVVFSISFSLIFLKYKQKSNRDKLPPGKKGWPIIGETLEFARIGQKGTPEMFIKDKMREYSQDLFKTSMFGENMVVCCGASGHKFLFSNEKKMCRHLVATFRGSSCAFPWICWKLSPKIGHSSISQAKSSSLLHTYHGLHGKGTLGGRLVS